MIHIYAPQPSARLIYTIDLLFKNLLQTEVQVHTEEAPFLNSSGFMINYSHRDISADLHWRPHEIMERNTLEPVEVEVRNWKNIPVLFPRPEAKWPFELFAAVFFLASRYEEYLPHRPDRHQRYTAEESVAFKFGFLQRPLINEWAASFKKLILEFHPEIHFESKAFRAEATFDIDVAWAYRNKGWWRTAGAMGMDIAKRRFGQLSKRWGAIRGKVPDPYDTYAYIRQQTNRYHIKTRYFFLLGDYSSYDRNSKSHIPEMQKLIRECAQHGSVGIHPSYGSHRSVNQLAKEIKRLRKITGNDVTISRQHYLKMTMPETFQRLLDCGILHDFTLGYAQQAGFRASLCTPFRFFDLQNDAETNLWLHPFAYMDGTLQQYMNLDIAEAKKMVRQLVGAVRTVNGDFICLWHNSSLSDQGDWKGWRDVFEYTLQLCAEGIESSKLPQ